MLYLSGIAQPATVARLFQALNERHIMTQQRDILYIAFELSKHSWNLCFSDGVKRRRRTISAWAIEALSSEIPKAKEKFHLPAEARVVSCHEAGRDGFSVHRMLEHLGVESIVMDPASIMVDRRARRRKTDGLDVEGLMSALLLSRFHGVPGGFRAVVVPDVNAADTMRVERERERLVKEHTGHCTRIRALCALHGRSIPGPVGKLRPEALRDWLGDPLPPGAMTEIERECLRLALVSGQIAEMEQEQKAWVKARADVSAEKAAKLMRLKGVGLQSASILSKEMFAWRKFPNRKAVGSFAGLTGTPYDSGQTLREQGISKAGNRRVRRVMIELAWGWVRYQPDSNLTRWFHDKCNAYGTSRARKRAIVALARKLLVALWKYIEHDIPIEGATLKA